MSEQETKRIGRCPGCGRHVTAMSDEWPDCVCGYEYDADNEVGQEGGEG